MKVLTLIMVATLLTGCGSDSSSSGSGIVAGTFSDSSVSNFSQISGYAKSSPISPEQFLEMVIPSAYAGGGSIRCDSSSALDISFQMDALGNTVTVDTTCTTLNAIELAIRRGLLASMDGMAIKRVITDADYKDGALDFRIAGANGSFQWDTGYRVLAINDANGDLTTGDNCYDTYTFVSSTGKLTIAPDTVASNAACLCVTTPGHADCQLDTVSFRFKDGTLELDLTNSDNYDSGLSTYEKWEACTPGVDCEV